MGLPGVLLVVVCRCRNGCSAFWRRVMPLQGPMAPPACARCLPYRQRPTSIWHPLDWVFEGPCTDGRTREVPFALAVMGILCAHNLWCAWCLLQAGRFFAAYHAENLEGMQSMLDKEIWRRIPAGNAGLREHHPPNVPRSQKLLEVVMAANES